MSLELEVGPLAELPPGTMKLVEYGGVLDRRLQLRRAPATRSRIAAPTTTGRSATATGSRRVQGRLPAARRELRPADRQGARAAGVPAGAHLPGARRGRRRQGRGRLLTAAPSVVRCWPTGDPLYVVYHDEEWGRPVRDERGVYERLCLEGFQSGLSWLTILRKREAFRAAFAGFDPDRVAAFGDADVERLLGDAGIVRHRGKIEAAIANARATVALRDARRAAAGAVLAARAGGASGAAVARRLGAVDARVDGARQAPAQGGLPVRRPDDDLRRDAGLRGRERPPRGVLGARRGRARAGRLMLDERVLAVLRRLEDEDARDDAPARPRRERSLAIAPSSGALLFGLAAGRVGCELLEIGGSRGYSTLWLGAAARLAGGRLTSLEAEPAKVPGLIENVAAAGPRRLGRDRARRRVRDAAGARRRLGPRLPRRVEGGLRVAVRSRPPPAARRQRRGRRQRGLPP